MRSTFDPATAPDPLPGRVEARLIHHGEKSNHQNRKTRVKSGFAMRYHAPLLGEYSLNYPVQACLPELPIIHMSGGSKSGNPQLGEFRLRVDPSRITPRRRFERTQRSRRVSLCPGFIREAQLSADKSRTHYPLSANAAAYTVAAGDRLALLASSSTFCKISLVPESRMIDPPKPCRRFYRPGTQNCPWACKKASRVNANQITALMLSGVSLSEAQPPMAFVRASRSASPVHGRVLALCQRLASQGPSGYAENHWITRPAQAQHSPVRKVSRVIICASKALAWMRADGLKSWPVQVRHRSGWLQVTSLLQQIIGPGAYCETATLLLH